ncbi:transglycosylase family protein [Pseudonocardia sp. TRM90224]|uniref:transglycosylase family protein n=1 Tax=Pseudonocardia sp. TRM90224 TaxID=2812678 RepID=UPI001E39B102|nr:transglycosylase family protein [Pseudonocardia sp. TRM90224]
MSALTISLAAVAAAATIASPPSLAAWRPATAESCSATTHTPGPSTDANHVHAARRLVALLNTFDTDQDAAALSRRLRSIGFTPAIASGWRQQAHDVADILLIVAPADPSAMRVAVILAGSGFSPTPADLHRGPDDPTSTHSTAAATTTPAATIPATDAANRGQPVAATSTHPATAQPLATPSSTQPPGASTPTTDSTEVDNADPALTCGDEAVPALAEPASAAPHGSTEQGESDPGESDRAKLAGWADRVSGLAQLLSTTDDPAASELASKLAAAPENDTARESGAAPEQAPDNHTPAPRRTDPADPADAPAPLNLPSSTTAMPETPTAASATCTSAPTAARETSWEADAQALSDMVVSYIDGDPTARAVADVLVEAGFPPTSDRASAPQTASTRDPFMDAQNDTSNNDRNRGRDSRFDTQFDNGSDDRFDDGGLDDHFGNHDHASGRDENETDEPGSESTRNDSSDGALEQQSGPESGTSDSGLPPTESTTTTEGPEASGNDAGVWHQLAACESSGDWSIDSGNGYYGGLQFDAATWRAYGGAAYAPTADGATKEQQIEVATKLRDARGGYGSWPACSQKLGLDQ